MHYYDVEGSLICSEDNDDNNKYLVTQYDVEQAIFNGEYIPVPTESVINQMDKVYEKTDKNQLEYGFRVGTQWSLTHIVE